LDIDTILVLLSIAFFVVLFESKKVAVKNKLSDEQTKNLEAFLKENFQLSSKEIRKKIYELLFAGSCSIDSNKFTLNYCTREYYLKELLETKNRNTRGWETFINDEQRDYVVSALSNMIEQGDMYWIEILLSDQSVYYYPLDENFPNGRLADLVSLFVDKYNLTKALKKQSVV
jgi:hypothetical protein